jgi:hypothetical protein
MAPLEVLTQENLVLIISKDKIVMKKIIIILMILKLPFESHSQESFCLHFITAGNDTIIIQNNEVHKIIYSEYGKDFGFLCLDSSKVVELSNENFKNGRVLVKKEDLTVFEIEFGVMRSAILPENGFFDIWGNGNIYIENNSIVFHNINWEEYGICK